MDISSLPTETQGGGHTAPTAQRNAPIRVVAITGGKGGVGKTNVSVNLGMALARLGRDVMLLDADLGLANVDVLLGLHPRRNLSHVMRGECTLDEIVIHRPEGLMILPGSSGILEMASLGERERYGLIRAFDDLGHPVEYLLVDTAAGISPDVIGFARAAQDVVVVVCDEPASITDAYALIKVLHTEQGVDRFHVVSNMVRNASEGLALYRKLAAVSERFLDVVLRYLGAIPYDPDLRKAVQRQEPVVTAYPQSRSALGFLRLARSMEEWPPATDAGGDIAFFVERLVSQRVQAGG
ncbi:MAG TPA: MinD/ParA family protein [Chromatiales bacterium]|nr:MinD/ParA family protein [Chromatiales bacterium]